MMPEEVKRWLRLAEDDLKSAQVNFDNKQYYVCVFLCHQSVEKTLKAALIKTTSELIKTHDLVFLGKKVDLPVVLLNKCEKLNGVYLDTRYGDVGSKPPSKKFNKTATRAFLNISKEVIAWLKENILNA